MKNFYVVFARRLSILVFFTLIINSKTQAQCPACGALTFTVNLTAAVDTAWSLANQPRSGNCCGDNNCVRFVVYLNPNAELINFNVTSPSPSGSAFYSINCGSLTSIGTPVCIFGQNTVCITYCKPGGDSPTYNIIQTKNVKASKDKAVRLGCSTTLTVTGLSAASASWTSIFPGTIGQYNSFLSCVTGCSLTTITPTAIVSPYIDYKVSGLANPICGGSTTDTVRVYIVPGLTANITPTNAVICSGGTGSVVLTSTVSGGAPPYTYSWSSGANTNTASVGIGTHTLIIQDTVSSCPAITNTIEVFPVATPSAPVLGNNSALCVGQTLSLTATNSGGTTWTWTGPNGFTSTLQNPTIPVATTSASGTYSATMSFSGCTGPPGITTATISEIPAVPTVGSNGTLCAGSTISLTATFTAGATYFWSGPNGFTSNVQNPIITGASTLASGTYSVAATIGGCMGPVGTVTVQVNPIPATPTAANNSAICEGQTLSLTSNPSGSIYNWTGPNGFTSTIQNPIITAATTSASGTYSVTQTVLGCTSPVAITEVTVNPIPTTPTVANNSAICEGQTLNLTSNPSGSIYNWIGPNGFTSTLQNPTIPAATTSASGTYSVTQTVLGCISPVATTEVTVNPIPATPVAGSNSSLCAGQTLSLTASTISGAVYNWTGPNSFTSTTQDPVISPAGTSESGTYSVYVSVLGCAGPLSTVNVTINPIPAAPAASNNSSLCAGQTLNLIANPGGAIYNWTGPNGFTSSQQNPSITNSSTLATGDYSVTQTVLGCTSSEGITSVTIIPVPNQPGGSSNSPVCVGQALTFSINTSGGMYSWTGPNSFTSSVQNPTIFPATGLATGDYSVTITTLGCTSPVGIISASVGIIPDAPVVTANSPLCAGSTLSLSATFTAGVTYNWTGPNSFTATGQNPVIAGTTTLATGVYTVNGNINGCDGPPSTVTVVVDVPAIVDAGIAKDTICAGNMVIPVNGTVTGNGITGTWSTLGTGSFNNPNSLSTIYNVSPSDTAAGIIKLILTSAGGSCPIVLDTITYTVLRTPIIDAGANLNVCKNAYVALNATISSVSNTGTWTSTGTGVFNPNVSALNGYYIPSSADTAAGGVMLTLETTNNYGCPSKKDSLYVTFIASPKVDFSNTNACVAQPLNFTNLSTPSSSVAGFSWNFGDGIGTSSNANPTYTYGASNTYTVTYIVTLSNGCKDSVRKPVTVYNTPLTDFTFTNICIGQEALFIDASGVSPDTLVSWSWNFGNANTSGLQNPINVYNSSGTFPVNLTVTSSKGCSNSATKTVTVNANPLANFNMSSTNVQAYENVFFTDLSGPGGSIISWNWSFDNSTSTLQNPENVFIDKGEYTVNLAVKDVNGCMDTVSKAILVTLLPMVPNAFTPNNDGHNDLLFVKGGPFVKMSLRVYNNWGEMVFDTNDQDKGWDGKYKGEPVPLGVYVWILDVDMYNGKSVRKTGDVTILK